MIDDDDFEIDFTPDSDFMQMINRETCKHKGAMTVIKSEDGAKLACQTCNKILTEVEGYYRSSEN